jgi:hypothetical protein
MNALSTTWCVIPTEQAAEGQLRKPRHIRPTALKLGAFLTHIMTNHVAFISGKDDIAIHRHEMPGLCVK